MSLRDGCGRAQGCFAELAWPGDERVPGSGGDRGSGVEGSWRLKGDRERAWKGDMGVEERQGKGVGWRPSLGERDKRDVCPRRRPLCAWRPDQGTLAV